MIQRSCVYHWLSIIITTEHDKQIADHSGLLIVVKFYNFLVGKFVERHLHHGHSTLDYLLASLNDSIGLLATQHNGCYLRGVCQIVDTSLYDLNASQSQTFGSSVSLS